MQIVAVWSGSGKPPLADFLAPLVDDFQASPNVQSITFVCYAPAKAFIRETKGHSSYVGCDACRQVGSIFIKYRLCHMRAYGLSPVRKQTRPCFTRFALM